MRATALGHVGEPIMAFARGELEPRMRALVPRRAAASPFRERAGVASTVSGPGSLEQAHEPDEHAAVEQLEEGEIALPS